jgi:GNAT superfamily N-acetyltransferase
MEEAPEKPDPGLEQHKVTIPLIRQRLRREWQSKGAWRTFRFLCSRVFRCWNAVVYDADLELPRAPSEWGPDETLDELGPDEIEAAVTPALMTFLGGDGPENLDGVRNGNRLFLVSAGGVFLHCGYILFRTRQTKLIGEPSAPPVIACCFTSPAARGRGLYRKALNAELCFLRDRGYKRAVIETDPGNTPSRKGIEAAGFRLTRTVRSWILLNWLVLQRSVELSGSCWRVLFL